MAAKMGIGKAIHKPMAVSDYEPPSTMHINLKKHKVMDGTGNKIGGMVRFGGHGKVTAIHKDSMGHRMTIEIHKIAPELP